MSKPYIYLSPPHMGDEERIKIDEAFASNWLSSVGPHIQAFEEEVAHYVGAQGAVALSSGTAAIHLALRLAGVEAGDYVLCSTFTFIASVNPILYLSGIPVFVDSEPNSWNMSPEALERACEQLAQEGKTPKAAVIVHLYGQSADMDAIMTICNRYGIIVVEDAAESLGTTYRGRHCGTIGHFGIYSFNGNKLITTSGGGMLVSSDPVALRKARHWATQAKEDLPYYEHYEMGYNYRMSNVLAGIGRGQLTVIEGRIAARRAVYQRYRSVLEAYDGIRLISEPTYGRSTCWLTVILVDCKRTGTYPLSIKTALQQNGIESRLVWKPMHLQPMFHSSLYFPHESHLSVSEQLFAQGLCLPSGSNLTSAEQDRVVDVILEHLQQNAIYRQSV